MAGNFGFAPMNEQCRLCGASAPLLDSHILPAFAFKAILDHFREKARHAQDSMATMSQVQADKIDAAVLRRASSIRNSRQMAAMEADAAMFGRHAVVRKGKRAD